MAMIPKRLDGEMDDRRGKIFMHFKCFKTYSIVIRREIKFFICLLIGYKMHYFTWIACIIQFAHDGDSRCRHNTHSKFHKLFTLPEVILANRAEHRPGYWTIASHNSLYQWWCGNVEKWKRDYDMHLVSDVILNRYTTLNEYPYLTDWN